MCNKMKKFLSLIMSIIMATIMLSVLSGCFAKASEGLEFKSNGDGTCNWCGLGSCADSEIIVPEKWNGETVVGVSSDTLNFKVENVARIKLPKTIKVIEEDAFDRVSCLEKVELNEGLETIEDEAFNGCENIQAISFPSTLKKIGEWAFARCGLIAEVKLPEGLTELGKFAFDDCTSIKKISIPSTLNSLHFISTKGGNCGFEFPTESIEEVNIAGDWNYTSLAMNIDGDELSAESIYYYGELVQDITKTDYPGSYYKITDKNRESVICALFNKKELKVNGKTFKMTEEKPLGTYEISGAWGFTKQEFTKESGINISYEGWSKEENQKDVVCGNYKFNKESKTYSFEGSAVVLGSNVKIEKLFVSFGDFILSAEVTTVDGKENGKIQKWIPYTETIKNFVEEEVKEEQINDIVDKKDDLLADLIAAFKSEGIGVSVDSNSGELSLDSSVLFGGDSAELTQEGKSFLSKFIKVYTQVIYSEKYDGFISKTIVEGHTAPISGSTYESGLPLSEKRADEVKKYCISSESGIDTSKLSKSLDAVGMSNSKPMYDQQGKVDLAASRRVSFRFIINLG